MKLEKAVSLAIDNVIKEGITDVDAFSKQFEIEMLNDQNFRELVKSKTIKDLRHKDIQSIGFKPLTHVLIPKKDICDFRKCALIEPIDEIKYLALCLQISETIESNRPSKSKNCVFSYRFSPNNGYIFDTSSNYTAFRRFVREKCHQQNVKVMVVCDIANFYDRLNLHRLECILTSLPNIDRAIIQRLNELLLFWSNRDSYGIPTGSNASRILAEASLIEVDIFLQEHEVSYCRYVDDFRIFAPDAATAHQALSLLVQKLSKEGLFLNTKKTDVINVSEYKKSIGSENTEAPQEPLSNDAKSGLYKIIRGYSGTIPTKFRALSSKELTELSKKPSIHKEIETSTKSEIIISHKDVIRFIRTGVAQKDAAALVCLVEQLPKYSQFIPYITDAIRKNTTIFDSDQVIKIVESMQYWLNDKNAPEYISIYVARFLGNEPFLNKQLLLNTFLNLKRNNGNYIGRVLLEQLEPHLIRGEIIEIRDFFSRSDYYERRQISKIISQKLTVGEARPFLKNATMLHGDIFIEKMYNDLK